MLPGPVFAVELMTTARRARYYALRTFYGLVLLVDLLGQLPRLPRSDLMCGQVRRTRPNGGTRSSSPDLPEGLRHAGRAGEVRPPDVQLVRRWSRPGPCWSITP